MSLYRGAGGASDATDDSTVNAVAGYASDAATSAAAAAVSAEEANVSATSAAANAAATVSVASAVSINAANAAISAELANTSAIQANNSSEDAAASAALAASYVVNTADFVHVTGNETIAGVKTFSSNPIFSAGDSYGVSYLNNSKVLTSGTALAFDGTKYLTISSDVGSRLYLEKTGALASTNFVGYNSGMLSYNSDQFNEATGSGHQFVVDGTERMRVTSAGVDVTGTTAISGAVTLSGGTPNGVSYLNGSKVVTTGTTLVFDGAQLNVNGITLGRGAGGVVQNLAVGYSALASNTDGDYNVAIGLQSLYTNSSGESNTAVGSQSLYSNLDGFQNTAVGDSALFSNISGDFNTAIGYQAGKSALGNGNVMVGKQAGYYEIGSNSFYVDNQLRADTAGDKAGALLYGVFNTTPASQTLKVNAALTATYGITLSTGTANSVAYLDGSKVITANNNLTFDGSDLAINGTTAVVKSRLTATTGSAYSQYTNSGSTFRVGKENSTGEVFGVTAYASVLYESGDYPVVFAVNATEQMRLTATTLSLTNNPTLSAGTANGVTYLNGSKVLTSGSALTFDGTNLAVGAGSAVENYIAVNAATYAWQRFRIGGTDRGYIGTPNSFLTGGAGTDFAVSAINNLVFGIGSTEQMRLTSTGLGIGTSSPVEKLTVNGAIAVTGGITGHGANRTTLSQEGANGAFWQSYGANTSTPGIFQFRQASSDFSVNRIAAIIDYSGNLGLGVTPSAWSTFKVLELPGGVHMGNYTGSNNAFFGANSYFNGSAWVYKATANAARYQINGYDGSHAWLTAPSGTAGAAISFTQAMTLDASGNLGVGTTSPTSTYSRNLHINGSASAGVRFTSTSYTDGFDVVLSAGDAYLLNRNSTSLIFGTSGTERARIDSSGNLLVGTTSTANSSKQTIGFVGSTTNGLSINDTEGTTVSVGYVNFSRSGTSKGSVTYSDTSGLVSYNTTSDYRAKDIIGFLTDSGALIDATPVYMGKMKGATQERPMFIAHETPDYAHTGEKDAVDAEGNPVYQQMDASALVPVMWAEIKSLRQRLAALEAA